MTMTKYPFILVATLWMHFTVCTAMGAESETSVKPETDTQMAFDKNATQNNSDHVEQSKDASDSVQNQNPNSVSPAASFEELVSNAVQSYGEHNYEPAISLFLQAYNIQAEPELLYNIARCYERMALPENAVEMYQKFIDTPGSTGDLRIKALSNIATLNQEIAARKLLAETKQIAAASSDITSGETNTKNEDEPETAAASTESPATADTNDSYPSNKSLSLAQPQRKANQRLKVIGWTVVGTGVVAMGVGGAFGVMAIRANNNFDDAENNKSKIEYRDDVNKDSLIFDIAVFGGAAITSVGIALLVTYAVKHRHNDRLSRTSDPAGKVNSPGPLAVTPGFFADTHTMTAGLTGRF